MRKRLLAPLSWPEAVWGVVSAATLATVVFYGFQGFNLGFNLDSEWRVRSVSVQPPDPADAILLGDSLLSIGDMKFEVWSSDRTASLAAEAPPGETVAIELSRDGRRLVVEHRVPDPPFSGWFRMEWYLPLLFWLAGTATVVFVRPRSRVWLALVALWFDTAIWLSAGFPSFGKIAYSSVVFHAFIWASAPLLLHVHLELPHSIGSERMRRAALRGAYALAVALAVLDFFQLFPSLWFLPWLGAGIAASMLIIGLRVMRSRGSGIDAPTRLMQLGTALGWGAILLYAVVSTVAPNVNLEVWTSWPFILSVALLFPIWPLSYFYALHRHRGGTVGFRANRVVGTYAFIALFVIA